MTGNLKPPKKHSATAVGAPSLVHRFHETNQLWRIPSQPPDTVESRPVLRNGWRSWRQHGRWWRFRLEMRIWPHFIRSPAREQNRRAGGTRPDSAALPGRPVALRGRSSGWTDAPDRPAVPGASPQVRCDGGARRQPSAWERSRDHAASACVAGVAGLPKGQGRGGWGAVGRIGRMGRVFLLPLSMRARMRPHTRNASAERGIVVSYETVRRWCKKFGGHFAGCLRRRRPRPGDKWHLDEVFIRILGVQHYLWRAVDQDGVILDILVQERRDGKAARRFLRCLLKGLQYVPRVIVTDKLRSYGVAQRHLLPDEDKVATSTIVLRTRIDPHADENDRCNASSPASKRRTSFPLTHSSTATSIHADTSWRP